ncbi:hypothetical protein SYNPS1DRAFT_15442, partial [Syncephalis pseudoplumigaleata]
MSAADKQKEADAPGTETPATVPFLLGCTQLDQGVIHLYREWPHKPATTAAEPSEHREEDDTLMASVLAVPAHMTPADLLAFLGSAIDGVSHIRLLRDASPHRYIALLKFRQS